jgi:hypothetical protein
MFLSAYHFDGDVDDLLSRYDAMREMIPLSTVELHACVVRDDGITVFDACPDRETAEMFQSNGQFKGTLEAVGLPMPRIEQLGDVHNAYALGGQKVS